MINFLLKHPELITGCKDGSLNARIFTKFFDSMSGIPDFNSQLPLIQILAEGSIGQDASLMFTSFIHNKLDRLISPTEMFEQKEKDVLKQLESVIGKEDKYRADIANILSTRLINHCLVHVETGNSVTKDMINRLVTILESKIFASENVHIMLRKLGTQKEYSGVLTEKTIEYFTKD